MTEHPAAPTTHPYMDTAKRGICDVCDHPPHRLHGPHGNHATSRASAPLDVEGLTAAIRRVYNDPAWEGIDPWDRAFASMVAAEYARLTTTDEGAGESWVAEQVGEPTMYEDDERAPSDE